MSEKKTKKNASLINPKYTKEQLIDAVEQLKIGKATTYSIQKQIGIPITTLQNHTDGKAVFSSWVASIIQYPARNHPQ